MNSNQCSMNNCVEWHIFFNVPCNAMPCHAMTWHAMRCSTIYADRFELILSTPHRTNWLRIQTVLWMGIGECVSSSSTTDVALLKCYCYCLCLSVSLSHSHSLCARFVCLYSFRNCVISVSVWYNSFAFNIAWFLHVHCNALHRIVIPKSPHENHTVWHS